MNVRPLSKFADLCNVGPAQWDAWQDGSALRHRRSSERHFILRNMASLSIPGHDPGDSRWHFIASCSDAVVTQEDI